MKKFEFLGIGWFVWMLIILVVIALTFAKAYIYKAVGVPVTRYSIFG